MPTYTFNPAELSDEDLKRAPRRAALAFYLCEIKGHSQSEVADLIGISQSAVSQRVNTAAVVYERLLTERQKRGRGERTKIACQFGHESRDLENSTLKRGLRLH